MNGSQTPYRIKQNTLARVSTKKTSKSAVNPQAESKEITRNKFSFPWLSLIAVLSVLNLIFFFNNKTNLLIMS
jgi:hypothetical protein